MNPFEVSDPFFGYNVILGDNRRQGQVVVSDGLQTDTAISLGQGSAFTSGDK
jgi:hypothetical protein